MRSLLYQITVTYISVFSSGEDGKVGWMYDGNKTDKEDYLLGKRVEKLSELDDEAKEESPNGQSQQFDGSSCLSVLLPSVSSRR